MRPLWVPTFAAILCLFGVQAFAQSQGSQTANPPLPKSVRVAEAATPLRTGPGVTYPIVVTEAVGTVLEVSGRDGDWYRITLSPDLVTDASAPRTAYVLARLVSPVTGSTTTPQAPITTPQGPVTGSIATPQGIPTSQPPPQSARMPDQSATTLTSRRQSSDTAIGWCVVNDVVSFPLCLNATDTARISNSTDFVAETSLSHKSVLGVGASLLGFSAGLRFGNVESRSNRIRGWGQITGGGAHASVSALGVNLASGWGVLIEPGFGADIGVTPAFAIRPEFDFMFVHGDGGWGHATRFALSAVWRFYKH